MGDQNKLKIMSRNELLQYHRSAAQKERSASAQLIAALKENIRRELFKEMGYSSLNLFIMQELHYESGPASRRANAAYAVLELERANAKISSEPLEKKIERGELSVTSLGHINRILKQERYVAKRSINMNEKKQILKAVLGKSERDAQKNLTQFQSAPLPKWKSREQIVSRRETQITMLIDDNFYQEIQEAMHLLSHVNPTMDHLKLYKYLVRDYLKRKSPMKELCKSRRSANSARSNSNAALSTNSARSIPKHKTPQPKRQASMAQKRAVTKRDGPGCSYTDPLTKKRCNSQHKCQLDHVHAWSRGGLTTIDNLRLLCAAHNRYVYKTQQQFLNFHSPGVARE